MSYNYGLDRNQIFTEQGQRLFLQIRDRAHALIRDAGAARIDAIIQESTGSTWTMLACVDRMVELGEIREITPPDVRAQDRIFVFV